MVVKPSPRAYVSDELVRRNFANASSVCVRLREARPSLDGVSSGAPVPDAGHFDAWSRLVEVAL